MTTFYLIRHGNKKRQPGNLGLSELGKLQAERTARYTKKLHVTAIYTSPYTRAKETSQIISCVLRIPITEENLLKERMNWGKENQSFDEFIQDWEYATNNPEFKPKYGYSVKETAKRMGKFMRKLASNAENGHIILVTHGGAIRDYLVMLSEKHRKIFANRQMEGVRECSITKIIYNGNKSIVEYFDKTDHLENNLS